MDDLMKEEATKEGFVLKDYFEFEVVESKEEDDLIISVDVKPKGKEIIEKKKLIDPDFNEEDYFQSLVQKALQAYIATQKNDDTDKED
jgi:hypothetical protein